MRSFEYVLLFAAISGLAMANPAMKQAENIENYMDEMRSTCDDGKDPLSCMKLKVMSFLNNVFKKDEFQVTDDIEVRKNGYAFDNEITARSQSGLLETVENYIQAHDVTFSVPTGAKVTVSPRNLDDNELNLKFKFANDDEGVPEARKSKLKKIAVPIMVFILLKAMTLIPLAIGILSLKAWNALQLSFFSFVVSVALAVFQLCRKLANEHPPIVPAHGGWDGRSFYETEEEIPAAQQMAYNAYA